MAQPYIDSHRNYTEHPDLRMFSMHTHENHEIYCFLAGDAKYYVEGTVYHLKPNDILIMKKAEAHSLLMNSDIPYDRIVINFNAEALLGSYQNRLTDYLDKRPLGCFNHYPASKFSQQHWLEYLDRICNSDDMDQQQLYLTILLAEMLEAVPQLEEKEEVKDNMLQMIGYINRHLTERLSLELLCKKFYISKSQLNRNFKKLTGATVWEYIRTKRLIMAKELMQNGVPPTIAALQCGFREYSSFFYAYKGKYGISPQAERKYR